MEVPGAICIHVMDRIQDKYFGLRRKPINRTAAVNFGVIRYGTA
jgi:hypothetical protein